jgi:4-amino-4-deoxy-L-arabinose transferase-like glycosyltransferase
MIDKIFQGFFSRRLLLIIILITIIVFAFSMWHRFIYIDDCWHGEESYWLAKDGVVKTKSMEGILGFENKVMVYHKLNIILGAVVIKLFGWSVYNLKLMTLFFYTFFFFFLYKFTQKFSNRYTINHYIISSLFIFVNPLMVHLGFTFRPEILAMFFGFLSYSTLESYLQSSKTKWLAASGLFAGLAFFTHLNAMIFPIAGFVILLFNRKFKPLAIYSAITLCTCMLYTYDLWQGNNFQVFVYQIKNWPTLKFGVTYFDSNIINFIVKKAVNLLNEHQRFFWGDKVMVFSAIFFFALISKFKFLASKYRSLLVYTLTLIIALNLTGSHIAERFLIYYYPFMALIVAIAIVSTYETEKKYYLKLGFVILTACHLFFVGFTFNKIFAENENSPAIHREISERLNDPKAKVLAPDKFIFNEIENRPILSYHVWEYYEDLSGSKLNQEKALKLASELGAKYIILDSSITKENDPLFKNGIIKENPYFKKMMNYKNYLILKRI